MKYGPARIPTSTRGDTQVITEPPSRVNQNEGKQKKVKDRTTSKNYESIVDPKYITTL
jgi:hypothetical protein